MPGTEVAIATADGSAPAWLFTPAGKAPWPAAVMFIDGLGMRPAMMEMAERLSGEGYVVLLPNLFYRSGPPQPFPMNAFSDEKERAKLMAVLGKATIGAVRKDTEAYLGFLAGRPEVKGSIACFGYCFGGSRALTALGAFPERVTAAAAFHASNLATDAPDSPHLLAENMKRGRVYVGIAGIDQSVPPEEEGRLASALRAADVDHAIENYPGVRHGFAVSDTPVYHRPAAERAWNRLVRLFRETLH